MLKEFKEFLARGNVIDLAVAVIIGAAFGKIVTSLVEGIIMPPIGLLVGQGRFCQSLPGARSLEGRPGFAGRCESERHPGGCLRRLHKRHRQLCDHCICDLSAGQNR